MRVMISIILMVIAALVGFFFGAGMRKLSNKSELCAQIRASIQGTAAQPGTGRENSGTGRSGAAFTACSDAAAAD